MKLIEGKKKFQPFQLLIETEDEAKLIAELLGATNGSVCEAIGVDPSISFAMYDVVSDYSVCGPTVFIEPYSKPKHN